jgi:hypothetical protein
MSYREEHDAKPETLTDRLLGAAEAARYLYISPRKLWQLSNTGQLPRVKIDGCVRYTLNDLESFVRSCKEGDTP